MFRVFVTKEFDDDFDKLDESDKIRVRKIREQLNEQGDFVGKPLGLPYFREKRFDEKRLYFIVYKKFMVILSIPLFCLVLHLLDFFLFWQLTLRQLLMILIIFCILFQELLPFSP